MARRFVQERWNFDAAAWRREKRAADWLDRAKERLLNSPASWLDPTDWMDLTRETEAAIALLETAGKAVSAEALRANAVAAHRHGEWSAFAKFCMRRNIPVPTRPTA
jgi:hypothetical protein